MNYKGLNGSKPTVDDMGSERQLLLKPVCSHITLVQNGNRKKNYGCASQRKVEQSLRLYAVIIHCKVSVPSTKHNIASQVEA